MNLPALGWERLGEDLAVAVDGECHAADAFRLHAAIIDGEAEITISGVKNTVKKGEIIIMPANEPHALQAVNSPYKMILTMIKSD